MKRIKFTDTEILLPIKWDAGLRLFQGLPVNYKHRRWIISFEYASVIIKRIQLEFPELAAEVQRLKTSYEKTKAIKSSLSAAIAPSNSFSLDVPPGLSVFPHQRAALEFIHLNEGRALICDDQGLGKTVEAILYNKMCNNKTIVVCPSNVKFNWANEIAKWCPGQTIQVYDSISQKATKEYAERGITVSKHVPNEYRPAPQWYIISYDGLSEINKELVFSTNRQFNSSIIDEVQYIKNRDSKRSNAVNHVCGRMPYILGLSGTPIENRPSEFFGILHLIKPEMFHWEHFMIRYCGAKKDRFGWKTGGATNMEELNDILKPMMIRRTKASVYGESMPPMVEHTITLPATPAYEKKQREILREDLGTLEMASKLMIASAWEKKDTIIKLAKERKKARESPVIIFYHHKKIGDYLESKLTKCARIDGSTPGHQRTLLVSDFQAGAYDYLLASTLACSTGITLTRACVEIFAEREWTPAAEDQAKARAHRIGQERIVEVWQIIMKNSIDAYFAEILLKKKEITSKIMDGILVKLEGV